MQKQKDMEKAMLTAHRQFVSELDKAVAIAEDELNQAEEMQSICTDEWCKSTELYLDELHNSVYSISEPRFSTDDDHKKIQELRKQVKDLYFRYKSRETA